MTDISIEEAQQLMMFGTPPEPPPVRHFVDWLPDADSAFRSLRGLPWKQHHLEMYGRKIPFPRLELFASVLPRASYTYSGIRHVALDLYEIEPLLPLFGAVDAFMRKETGAAPNAVFLNLYRDGSDSIDWHQDNEVELGPAEETVIASLSLGTRRRFSIRQVGCRSNRQEWDLGHGDLLLMLPGSQSAWEHKVPKTKKPVGERICLTFRHLEIKR